MKETAELCGNVDLEKRAWLFMTYLTCDIRIFILYGNMMKS